MIKVEEIIEKYKGYEVDEEKLKEFLTPPKPKTVYELKKLINIIILILSVLLVLIFGIMTRLIMAEEKSATVS